MHLTKANIDRFFDYDIHLESRTIYLGSEIDEGTTERVIKGLHLLGRISHNKLSVLLNSPGGCLYNGLAIFDAIKACSCPVAIEVLGHAMSMGSIILQAATQRIVHKNATIMIHDGTEYFEGKPRDLESWANHGKNMRGKIYEIYAERSGKSPKYWEDKCTHDFILSAEQAVKEKLADTIFTKAKR
jgi:ATP-dependent Clp protease protease subunit